MKSYPMILGVDPGSGQLGFSVLKGEELIYFGIKTIKDRSRSRTLIRMRRVLDTIVAQYKIEYIALEKVIFVQQNRTMTKIIFEEVKEYTQLRQLELLEYNPKIIRTRLSSDGEPTKKGVAENLSRRYKELSKFLDVPAAWQKRYFSQLYGAVAVALVCAREIKKNNRPLNKSENYGVEVEEIGKDPWKY